MSGKEIPQQVPPQDVPEDVVEVVRVDLEDGDMEGADQVDKEGEKCEKKGKKSSKAWDYFDEIKGCPVGFEKAKCSFCKVIIGCNTNRNGTSAMMNHLKTVCAKSPLRTNLDKLQKTLKFEKLSRDENLRTLKAHTFDQLKLRKKLAVMCIKDNQPFRIVEHEGFRELMHEAEPKFKMPSRWTVARDCLKIYSEELVKLKKCLVSERVSFTTDTWTSVQNINYMCLTAHWINKDWKICKRILNFRQIGSHKGDAIGKMLVELFRRWGIDRIFTITLDNASSNDTAISHLKKFLRGPEAILENKYLHMRCCAHILNLVVRTVSKTNQAGGDTWDEDYENYMKDQEKGGIGKSELDVYLADERERKSEGFNILLWWKTNSTRLPILSELSKHVLGMPVSSVASEAAFSTGGRTIDGYRSSLSPKTAKSLVCSQDWLRTSGTITDLRGEPEEYLLFEKMENDELKVETMFEKLDIDD